MRKLLTTLAATAIVCAGMAQEGEKPKNLIMFIGDGFGISAKTAARMALGQGTPGKRFTDDPGFRILALDKLQYNGTLTTHSLNSWITDSGPGASAYACGKAGKLDNESISFNVGTGEAVETILEAAKKQGYAVGIVTSTRVTHATPATFASHIWFRDLEDYIAAQYISSTSAQYEEIFNHSSSSIKPYNPARDWQLPEPKKGVEVDVILGGGSRHFLPLSYADTIKDAAGNPVRDAMGKIVTQTGKRVDNVNLIALAANRGYTYVNSRDALLNLDASQFSPENNKKLIGLFNASHVNYEQDRQMAAQWEPSLPEMTEIAIKVLKAKGGTKGFFLMVEGGRIDHLEHANSGGISVVPGSSNNIYVVDADKPSYKGGGEAIYGVTLATERHDTVFGSDYLIKEVLAFDYSVAQGRKLLADNSAQTLIFSSSDHECGGTAIVGLHDTHDAQKNGTLIRTYALGPKQNGTNASSGGAATVNTVANPAGTKRGDIDFGTKSPDGWYPNYTTYVFQDRKEELWPRVDTGGRRIVVSYASNPITNGNGANAGGTPGNHTPMDVWVGAEDNANGLLAGKISGRGQLDNTYLTQIMADFLKAESTGFKSMERKGIGKLELYPNPAQSEALVSLTLNELSEATAAVTDMSGRLIEVLSNSKTKAGQHNWKISLNTYSSGVYLVNVYTQKGSIAQKMVVSK